MECLHCRSCSSSSSSSRHTNGSALPGNLKFKNRSQKLYSIECSHEHRLTLQDCNAQLTASSSNLVRKLSSRNSSTSDLYQILGLFSVFEGVVITAVAQASALQCHNSWLIFALSALAPVATLFACIQKLREIVEVDRIYLEEKALCPSLFNSIEKLKEMGPDFDLAEGQPNLRHTYTDREDQSSDSPDIADRIRSFCKSWVRNYAGAVFFSLLLSLGSRLLPFA